MTIRVVIEPDLKGQFHVHAISGKRPDNLPADICADSIEKILIEVQRVLGTSDEVVQDKGLPTLDIAQP